MLVQAFGAGVCWSRLRAILGINPCTDCRAAVRAHAGGVFAESDILHWVRLNSIEPCARTSFAMRVAADLDWKCTLGARSYSLP